MVKKKIGVRLDLKNITVIMIVKIHVQETQLKEERKLSELHFVDFHTYVEIIEKKKKIFGPLIGKTETKDLVKKSKNM